MRESKKTKKESNIIDAAEKIFDQVGFKNAKMEDIASEAGITKVTLYSYFQSKENMYMAITFRALSLLNDRYYKTLDENRGASGLESALALEETFMSFCESNFLYSEALLEYFAIIRSTSIGTDNTKLTDGIKESIYYLKLQDIHNLPFKLTAKEIDRGIKDGSVHPEIDPMFSTLQGWCMIIGYVKIVAASGKSTMPLFNVSLSEIKKSILQLAKSALQKKVG